jgi:hypothetical protein
MGHVLLLAADSSARDWLPLVAAIVAALIAGWFGGRNARKTPHERLKSLVDIAKDMPRGVDRERTIERAIERELRQLERLNSAREESFPRYLAELIRQNAGNAFKWSSYASGLTVIALGFATEFGVGVSKSQVAVVLGATTLLFAASVFFSAPQQSSGARPDAERGRDLP